MTTIVVPDLAQRKRVFGLWLFVGLLLGVITSIPFGDMRARIAFVAICLSFGAAFGALVSMRDKTRPTDSDLAPRRGYRFGVLVAFGVALGTALNMVFPAPELPGLFVAAGIGVGSLLDFLVGLRSEARRLTREGATNEL